jgi:Abi-like protein
MPTFTDAVSADRFSTYRLWADQDAALAKRLYTFNVQLSAALYGPLHMLEVALRNVADRQLTAKRGPDWMDDPQTMTTKYQQDCVTKARENLHRDGKPATHGQMVAELNFGFWGSLFGRRSHHLWQDLRPIFQTRGIQRNHIAQQLDDFRALRNRVAHYEPIVALPLAQRYADITTLTGWLSPSAAAWISDTSEWPNVYPGVPILVTDPATNQTRVSPGVVQFLPA